VSRHTHTHVYAHIFYECCTGNINKTKDLLKPFLIITWEESNTACSVFAKHSLTNKQNKTIPRQGSRLRITQSTCKLIRFTCRRKCWLGMEVVRRQRLGWQKKTGEESKQQKSDLISRPCLCFCVCEGGDHGIVGFYLTWQQRKLFTTNTTHKAEALNQTGEGGTTIKISELWPFNVLQRIDVVVTARGNILEIIDIQAASMGATASLVMVKVHISTKLPL